MKMLMCYTHCVYLTGIILKEKEMDEVRHKSAKEEPITWGDYQIHARALSAYLEVLRLHHAEFLNNSIFLPLCGIELGVDKEPWAAGGGH